MFPLCHPSPGLGAVLALLVVSSCPVSPLHAQARTSAPPRTLPAPAPARPLPAEIKTLPAIPLPIEIEPVEPTPDTPEDPSPATTSTGEEPPAPIPATPSSPDENQPAGSVTPAAPLGDPEEEEIPEGRPVPMDAASIIPREEIIPEGKPVTDLPPPAPTTAPPSPEPSLQASMRTQADARTLYVTLPPPRGLIVDRNGQPLAQNILASYAGIQFPEGPPLKPADALAYAKQRIAVAVKVLGQPWDVKDEDILKHYENRRWLPLLNERVLKQPPPADQKNRLLAGTILHPAYLRTYPNGRAACHLLGSVGKVRPMATGPLDPKDPFYPELTGRDGLEIAYEEQLKGKAGQMNMLFDGKGRKISEEFTQSPVPGQTLVTTLDLDYQLICEDVLSSKVKRGAFVIMDVESGDILAMASWPMFDPNSFVPSISQDDYTALIKNKDKPLVGRAFQGTYPPASTFKVVTALAGLDGEKFDENSVFNCSSSLRLGKHFLRNAFKTDYGSIGLTQAMKISCNTWFARAGMATGSSSLTSMATRLGYGERTGLPIRGEAVGHVASDDWMMVTHGRKILPGDLANMSIGQGALTATPLQVARAMAAIANGQFTPQARLVSQFQDLDNKVIEAFPPSQRNDLNISQKNIKAVHKGMSAVVNDGGGTGRAAACRYVTVAGKTGTAQWGPDRNMAWFAGFLPADNPQYAFAAIYEGDIGESSISGGGKVAPMVKTVFDRIYKMKKDRDEPFYKRDNLLAQTDPEKEKGGNKKEGSSEEASDGENADDDSAGSAEPRRSSQKSRSATAASGATPDQPADAAAEKPARGFFKRLFSRE